MLELVRHHIAPAGEAQGGADVVVRRDDLAVRQRGRGAVRIRIEHGDAIAERTRGEGEHPPELTATEQPDRRRRGDRQAFDTEPAMDVGDPGLLLVGVLVRLDETAFDDAGLERGIPGDELRIGQ